MKSNRTAKLIALAVSALLIIGAIVGISVSADTSATAKIDYLNVAYEGAVRLVYDVKVEGTLAEDEKAAVLIWDKGEEQTLENATVVTEYTEAGDGYLSFYSEGFAPKHLRKPIAAKAAIVTVDAEGAVAAIAAQSENAVEYSVYDYVLGRFNLNQNTKDQAALYTALLDYGAAVQDVLYESNLASGVDEATAKVNAGLEYGYADQYYTLSYAKTAYVNGKLVKTDVETYNLRSGESVQLDAEQSYMRRVFARYATDGAEVDYLYDNDGHVVIVDKAQLAGTPRFVQVSPTKVGNSTVTAEYEFAAGSNTYTSSLNGTTDLDGTAYKTGTLDNSAGTYAVESSDCTDDNGNPYIKLYKQLRHVVENSTQGGGSISVGKASDYKVGDVFVGEFDVDMFGTFMLDTDGDEDTTNGTVNVDKLGADNSLIFNTVIRSDGNVAFFRVDWVVSGDKVYPRLATDGMSLEAKRIFAADGSFTDTAVPRNKSEKEGGNYLYTNNSYKGYFKNSITGETELPYSEIESIRMEMHHDGKATQKYRVYYYNADGTKMLDTNGNHIYDEYTVTVPTLKLYVNGVYWGSATLPYLYSNALASGAEGYATTYDKQLAEGSLKQGTVSINSTNNNSAELHITNFLVSAYDYDADGNVVYTLADETKLNYAGDANASVDYDVDGTIADSYADTIIAGSSVVVDSKAEDVAESNAYAYLEDGALWFGRVGVAGERRLNYKVPENVAAVANKSKFIFSTDLYIEDGATGSTGDFIRFRFASVANAPDGANSVTMFAIYPKVAIDLANAGRTSTYQFKNTDANYIGSGNWYNFTLVYDYGTQTTDIYCNGVLICDNYLEPNSTKHTATEINYVNIDFRGSSSKVFSNVKIGLDNTSFAAISATATDYSAAPILSTQAKDYVQLTTAEDAERGTVDHFTYSHDHTADNGSEAHVYWLSETQANPIDSKHFFVWETDIKFGDITHNTNTAVNTDGVYNNWMMYLSITDVNVKDGSTGDTNSISLMSSYNNGALRLGNTDVEANKWYHLRIEYWRVADSTYTANGSTNTADYTTVYWRAYLDDTLIMNTTTTIASNGNYNVDEGIWGFKMKCKNTKTFTNFNIYFDNTTLTEYTHVEAVVDAE